MVKQSSNKVDAKRELTKRQRWTVAEWGEVEKAAKTADKTPSDFIREATLKRCGKKTSEALNGRDSNAHLQKNKHKGNRPRGCSH